MLFFRSVMQILIIGLIFSFLSFFWFVLRKKKKDLILNEKSVLGFRFDSSSNSD